MKRFIICLLFLMVSLTAFAWEDTVPTALFTRQYHVSHADLTDADTSQDITLFTIPAGAMITDVWAYVGTQFTGGSVSAMTVAVGDTDADALAEEHDILGCGNATWILTGQQGTDKGDDLYDDTEKRTNRIYTSATVIKAQFASTTDNLVNLTAGDLDIYILYSQPK